MSKGISKRNEERLKLYLSKQQAETKAKEEKQKDIKKPKGKA